LEAGAVDAATQYPIGKFTAPAEINSEQIKEWILQ
jgi:hypothetical protein